METYSLPHYEKGGFKRGMEILLPICIIACSALTWFSFSFIIKDDLVPGVLVGLMMLALSIVFIYQFTFVVLLKKAFIELTEEYLQFSVPFKSCKIYWKDMSELSLYEVNGQPALGILLIKDKEKRTKRSFNNNLNSLFGIPPSSRQIPLSIFKSISIEKLLITMDAQIGKAHEENNISVAEDSSIEEAAENNLISAVLFSFVAFLLISLAYGYSIFKLHKNYLVIALLGSMIIIALFNRFYIEKSFSLFPRIFLGLLCFIQIPWAIIENALFSTRLDFTFHNISMVTAEYIRYAKYNLLDQVLVLVFAIFCLGIGVFSGRVPIKKEDSN